MRRYPPTILIVDAMATQVVRWVEVVVVDLVTKNEKVAKMAVWEALKLRLLNKASASPNKSAVVTSNFSLLFTREMNLQLRSARTFWNGRYVLFCPEISKSSAASLTGDYYHVTSTRTTSSTTPSLERR